MTLTVRSLNHHDLTNNALFGQDLPDPVDAAYIQEQISNFGTGRPGQVVATTGSTNEVLYLTEPGDTTAISATDINQGQLGDCFLLSSFGEEALFHPSAIVNMIHDNSNGTETVTLYLDQNGGLPTFGSTGFTPTSVTINNVFSSQSVNSGANQDVVGNTQEIWPQVIEKAAATLDGGYNTIANGGYPVLAMEELTGQVANYFTPANLTLAALQQYVSAGDLITFDTSANAAATGYNLVGSHCYMFQQMNGSDSSAAVQLLNPWGTHQPASIPFAQLAQSGIVEIDIGHAA